MRNLILAAAAALLFSGVVPASAGVIFSVAHTTLGSASLKMFDADLAVDLTDPTQGVFSAHIGGTSIVNELVTVTSSNAAASSFNLTMLSIPDILVSVLTSVPGGISSGTVWDDIVGGHQSNWVVVLSGQIHTIPNPVTTTIFDEGGGADPTAAVPVPPAFALMGFAFVGMGLLAHRRTRRRA